MSPKAIWICWAMLMCACDSNGPSDAGPFRVIQVLPDEGTTTASAAGSVTIRFGGDANPGTLPDAITVVSGDDTLPARVTYDEPARAASVSAPFLPGREYVVKVSRIAHGQGGQPLEAEQEWSFSTAPLVGRVTDELELFGEAGWGGPALVADQQGRRHLFYSTFGEATYATCPGSCGSGAWPAVGLGSGRSGFDPSIQADASGAIHALHTVDGGATGHFLLYSQCSSDCHTPDQWVTMLPDPALQVRKPSLQLAADGSLHSIMSDALTGDLLYGYCPASCVNEQSWQFIPVVAAGTSAVEPVLNLGGDGRRHVAFFDFTSRTLRYATCAGTCASAADWSEHTADPGNGAGRSASIAQGPEGEVHVAYYDESARVLKFAVCRLACSQPLSWLRTTIDAGADVGREPSLRVDTRGRAHVAYYDFSGGALRYATCARDCEAPDAWRSMELDGVGDVGRSPALALANDRITIAYVDYTTGNPYPLRVME